MAVELPKKMQFGNAVAGIRNLLLILASAIGRGECRKHQTSENGSFPAACTRLEQFEQPFGRQTGLLEDVRER